MWRLSLLPFPHQETPINNRTRRAIRAADPAGVGERNSPFMRLLDQPDAELVIGYIAMRQNNLAVRHQDNGNTGKHQQRKPGYEQKAATESFERFGNPNPQAASLSDWQIKPNYSRIIEAKPRETETIRSYLTRSLLPDIDSQRVSA